jgi:predicted secreted hydrolase
MKCALPLAVVMLFLALLLSACAPRVYNQPYPARPLRFPQDNAAHAAPIEWWYYTGHLQDAQGHRYGFELTFFKVYTPPKFKLFGFLPAYLLAEKAYVGHFAITDEARGIFHAAQRSSFWGYQAGASSQTLNVYVGGWHAYRTPDGVHHLQAADGPYSINLTLKPVKPPALHGEPPGIEAMGPGGTSYYFSDTRMKVSGTLGVDCSILGCQELPVSGQAWHDHQWGNFSFNDYAGWNWFSLQFADNTELMLYLIRKPSGKYLASAGSFITPDGTTIHLTAKDFDIKALPFTWTSPTTGAIYPQRWHISVPRFGVDVMVTPVMHNQEMDTRASTGIVYWEGDVNVSSADPMNRGEGYVELTNYNLYPYGKTNDSTKLVPLQDPFAR